MLIAAGAVIGILLVVGYEYLRPLVANEPPVVNEPSVSDESPVVNEPPVAVDDTYSTHINEPLFVAAPDLLANDTDVDGDTLTAELASDPRYGEIEPVPEDDSFTYWPPGEGWSGTDSFSYKAFDGSCESSPATVTINVGMGEGASIGTYEQDQNTNQDNDSNDKEREN